MDNINDGAFMINDIIAHLNNHKHLDFPAIFKCWNGMNYIESSGLPKSLPFFLKFRPTITSK